MATVKITHTVYVSQEMAMAAEEAVRGLQLGRKKAIEFVMKNSIATQEEAAEAIDFEMRLNT